MSKYLDYVKQNAFLYSILMNNETVDGTKTRIIRNVLSELKAEMPVYGDPMENRYTYTFMIEGTCGVIERWIDHGFDMSTKDLALLIHNIYGMTHKNL